MQHKLLLDVYFFSVLCIFYQMWALLFCLNLVSLTESFSLHFGAVSCAEFHFSRHCCICVSLRQWVIALWCLYVHSWRFSSLFLISAPQSLHQATLYVFNPHKSFPIKSGSPAHINFVLHCSELFQCADFLVGGECRD